MRTIKTIVTMAGGVGQDRRYIDIADDRSGLHIARVSLTHEEFGRFVSGQMICVSEPAEVYQSENVGRRLVVGHCKAATPESFDAATWESFLDALAARVEAEGWRLQREGRNGHHSSRVAGVSVQLFVVRRWTDEDGEEFAPPNGGNVIEVAP
jgi:hypothetical protein